MFNRVLAYGAVAVTAFVVFFATFVLLPIHSTDVYLPVGDEYFAAKRNTELLAGAATGLGAVVVSALVKIRLWMGGLIALSCGWLIATLAAASEPDFPRFWLAALGEITLTYGTACIAVVLLALGVQRLRVRRLRAR